MRPRVGTGQLPSAVLALFVACLIPAASGCALFVFGVGATGGVAGTAYVMGKLEQEVEAPVPKVQRAAVAGLKDLDLPLVKETGDKLAAEIESRSADGKTVWIHIASLTKSKSQISIRVGWLGDEARSRRILEAVRAHL